MVSVKLRPDGVVCERRVTLCTCHHSLAAHSRSLHGRCLFCSCRTFEPPPAATTPHTSEPLSEDVLAALRILASQPAFAGITPEQLAVVARLGRRRIVPEGTLLFDVGDASERVWLILKGEMLVERPSDHSGSELRARLGPGDLLGEVALLSGSRHTGTVRALEDVLVLELTRAHLQDILDTDQALRLCLLRLVHQRVGDAA